MHRGTVDAGHYFAYIKPNLEDKWFEFNDSRVAEVTKHHALAQGAGGNITSFSQIYHGNPYYKNSNGQLLERYDEDDTNGYMLFYVREAERETIMNNSRISEDRIPKELSQYFLVEDMYYSQILDDQESQTFNRLFLLTDQILENANFNGALFTKRMHDASEPNGFDAASNAKNYMTLYIQRNVSVNEFIMMLKSRFFNGNDNV